ncbi:ATP-binding protein [Chromobacterium sp. LK1]|uniref:ATP-binding protein n=1 Tax=Chromobacterium sp. LK1 TaxID=1628193 RepID=UPI0009E4CB76|nr:ATP-binding protein [Chromobacterium sp. LK1]
MIMPSLARRSLYRRLLWTSLSTILAVWLVLFAWFYWEVTRVGSGYLDGDLRGLARSLGTVYSADIKTGERVRIVDQLIGQFGHGYSEKPPLRSELAYRIVDKRQHLLAVSNTWPELELPIRADAPANQGRWRILMVDAVDAPVQVQLAVARSFVQRVQAEILVFFLMPLIAAVPIIMLLLRVGYGRALQPLALLASTITSRDVQSTAPLACPDPEYQELRPVFNSVNELLSRLATFREGEQRFFADAAHELRTPLAAIGAQVHLLARAESEQERAALAALLDASIARSGELVGKLLTLSRLDAESAQVRSEPFDLAALARVALSRHVPHALARNINLAYDGEQALPCRGDASAMDGLLDNLLDNAIRYCPDGASINVEVNAGFASARLAVLDDGPGIAPQWREQVLKRFVRLPDNTVTGSGLGLAIVKRVVELHGGSLLLTDGLNGNGLGVEIRLPRSMMAEEA